MFHRASILLITETESVRSSIEETQHETGSIGRLSITKKKKFRKLRRGNLFFTFEGEKKKEEGQRTYRFG